MDSIKDNNKVQLFAFFSSRMAIPALKNLREEVWELGEKKIWVSERAFPTLSSESDKFYDEAEIHCLQMIRKSQEFICVLDGSYGATGWSRDWSQNEVSILELELFMAALERKPIHIFLLKPFDKVDPRLNSLLQIIENVCPEKLDRTPKSSEEIKARISSLLTHDSGLIHSKSRKNLNIIIGLLTQFLARIRALRPQRINNKFSDVSFLNGEFAPLADVPPDKDLISHLLNKVHSSEKSQDKLAKLWIAVRHLSAVHYEDSKYAADYLPLWDAILSNWSSTSSWYGLHGHIYLGRLATVNTLLKIREIATNRNISLNQGESIHGTYGAIASEYYSIAKMVLSRRDRNALLKRALDNINTAIQQGDPAGYLAIRGSIRLSLGRIHDAVSDYDRELQLRVKAGESAGQIGEAEVELGMGYFRLGKIFRAQELLESGLAHLRNSEHPGFIVRAMRKISLFYTLTLRRQRGLQMLEEAYRKAKKYELHDQIRQINSLPFPIRLILGKKNIDSVLSK